MTSTRVAAGTAAPGSYQQKMFDFLAERDPIEVMAETPSILAGVVTEHAPDVLRQRPFEGKWTPNEIIGHLTDSEWEYGCRLRRILSEDNPALIGTQQDAWVVALRHNEREPSELDDVFRTMRGLNLAVWRRVSPQDMNRCGQHSERGPESLGVMLRVMAGHDLNHLDQIRRYIQAVTQGA